MKASFLVIGWVSVSDMEGAGLLADRAAKLLGFEVICRNPRTLVLAPRTMPFLSLGGEGGVIIGEIWERASGRLVHELPSNAAHEICRTNGDHLVRAYWGDYIAVLGQKSDCIIRDPIGGIGCFSASDGRFRFWFSDVGISVGLGLTKTSVNWNALRDAITYNDTKSAETCLCGIREVLPGTRHYVSDKAYEVVWSPWEYAAPHRLFTQRDEAVAGLRETVLSVSRSLVATSSCNVVELSGGLDSSIVAAALGATGGDIRCLSLTTPDPGADERRYATAMAAQIGASVEIIPLCTNDIDVTDYSPVPKPRPSDHLLKRIVDLSLGRQIARFPTGTIFSGSGGDYVLGYSHTSAPAADALLAHGMSLRFLASVRDIATMHRCSLWRAARLAYKKARRTGTRISTAPPIFVRSNGDAPLPRVHPWLPEPAQAFPGKVEQIMAIIGSRDVRDGRDRESIAPLRMPLRTQPVIEHCLRIPTWMSVHGGRNRSVARDAFACDLPAVVLNRQTKGNFTGFLDAIVMKNASKIRDVLFHGNLQARGIVDRDAIDAYLSDERMFRTDFSARILSLISAEHWTQRW